MHFFLDDSRLDPCNYGRTNSDNAFHKTGFILKHWFPKWVPAPPVCAGSKLGNWGVLTVN